MDSTRHRGDSLVDKGHNRLMQRLANPYQNQDSLIKLQTNEFVHQNTDSSRKRTMLKLNSLKTGTDENNQVRKSHTKVESPTGSPVRIPILDLNSARQKEYNEDRTLQPPGKGFGIELIKTGSKESSQFTDRGQYEKQKSTKTPNNASAKKKPTFISVGKFTYEST